VSSSSAADVHLFISFHPLSVSVTGLRVQLELDSSPHLEGNIENMTLLGESLAKVCRKTIMSAM